ncbi:NRDE family protein [Wukongibacter baidiensis]|uniref:NRDE family protein n=1 Tax=Wukongibacter baidiensis TaxID=1723361 RepID=UPI003D7F2334
MCIIFFAYKSHPQYKLILATNRDEFYERPTENARFWRHYPHVLGGRDLEKMGTWLGINRKGEFAAITNYRDFSLLVDDPKSRGDLVKGFLIESQAPKTYMKGIRERYHEYNPYNLLVGNMSSLYYYSNVEDKIREVEPGIYGLSNALLDTPWPKLTRGKEKFENIIKSKDKIDAEDLYDILFDRWTPEDEELPETGMGLEWERTLSSIFIESPNYGTRSSTVVLVDNSNHVTFIEKSLKDTDAKEWNEVKYEFLV